MKICTVISHRNRPDLADALFNRVKELSKTVSNRVLIVDCGGDPYNRTANPCYWYPDPEFKDGKIRGHIEGVKLLGLDYDYYWLLHPDLTFNDDEALMKLLKVMCENPEIGLLSPTFNGQYSGNYIGDGDWHPVACVDYLSLLIRGDALREVGVLDGDFKYSVGADLDYGYRMWKHDWSVGFCDTSTMRHMGGTTYGAPGTGTISRREYVVNSGLNVFSVLSRKYGESWGEHMNDAIPEYVTGNQIMFCWDNRGKRNP